MSSGGVEYLGSVVVGSKIKRINLLILNKAGSNVVIWLRANQVQICENTPGIPDPTIKGGVRLGAGSDLNKKIKYLCLWIKICPIRCYQRQYRTPLL